MHGYEVRIIAGEYEGRIMTLQGREGRYALLYRRLGLGRAEFLRVPLEHVEAL
jgi:hypothetical protein